jgi:hypothetical protein
VWAISEIGATPTGTLLFVPAVVHVVVFDSVVTSDVLPGVIEYPFFLGFGLLVGTFTVAVLVTVAGTSFGADRPAG